MGFKYLFLLLYTPFFLFTADVLDGEIANLRREQERLKKESQKNANDAMRWQFQKENYGDARKAWEKVEQDKQKIQEIEERIEELERQKETLLEDHGSKKSS